MWLRSRRIPVPESPPEDSQHERNPNPQRRPPRENPFQLPGGLTAPPQFVLEKWEGIKDFVIRHPDLYVSKNSYRSKRVEMRPPADQEAPPNGRKIKEVRSYKHFVATFYARTSLLGNLVLKTDSQLEWNNDEHCASHKLGDEGIVVSYPGYSFKTDIAPESLVVENGQVITEHGLLVAYVVLEGSLGCIFLRHAIFPPAQLRTLENVSVPSIIPPPQRQSTPNISPVIPPQCTPKQIPTPNARTPNDNDKRDIETNASEDAEPSPDMIADSQANVITAKRRLFVDGDTSGNKFEDGEQHGTPLTESDPSSSQSASQIHEGPGWKLLHNREPELARYFAKARLCKIARCIHPFYLWDPATPPKGKQYHLRSLQLCSDARDKSLLATGEFINLPHQKKRNLMREGKWLEKLCYPDGKRSSGEKCDFRDVIRKGKDRDDSLYRLGY